MPLYSKLRKSFYIQNLQPAKTVESPWHGDKCAFATPSTSPDARSKQEVRRALDADTRLEEGLEPITLPAEAVHDVGAFEVLISTASRAQNRS